MEKIKLKKGKEKPVLQHHHWIYSGAIATFPSKDSPSIVPVYSASDQLLGLAALSHGRSISAHMLSFGETSLEDALRDRIFQAYQLRQKWFDPNVTNAYRLIHAEGDGIPGLIVDSYDGHLVMQISHPAIESIRDLLISILIQETHPKGIYEKSTSFLRKKEGLKEVCSHRFGEALTNTIIRENGLNFRVDWENGQKTGWFLDQREMRKQVRELSLNRSVLNMFAYTGGFSVSALAGGAALVDSVESSSRCEGWTKENILLNQLPLDRHRMICSDAFDFLKKEELPYDIVILDPPAFVKKREDIAQAFRAYKELNALAFRKMKPNSMLLTCSCSYHVSEELFQNIIFRAALESNRKVRILARHRQAFDHPVSIYHSESTYLKSFLLHLE